MNPLELISMSAEEEKSAASRWMFSSPEKDFLIAQDNDRRYLCICDFSINNLGLYHADISYLQSEHMLSIKGLMIISQDGYYSQIEKSIHEFEARKNLKRDSDVQHELEKLLIHAVNSGASDLHITRGDFLAKIEFRINGVLCPMSQIIAKRCDELIFVLYNVQASTKETTWNRSIPQSANILYTLNGKNYRFRYAHFPLFGETDECYHSVLRIISSGLNKSVVPDLEKIGVSKPEVEDIKKILSNPYGAYIIAGTTGSGKSTTLKNMMEWLQINRFDDRGCFLTIEDPVEYQIYGAKQSSVLDVDGGGFHSAIKSALRRDPDVLMVGEIRDPVSSNALAGAVESGHYCFTTVHAGNIVTLLQRLTALGIASDKLSTPGFIAGLQCQKLIPLLCVHCRTPHHVVIQNREFDLFVKSKDGCAHCGNTGIKSRQLVIEYMRPTLSELEAISRQDWLNVYTHWRLKRFTSDGLSEGFSLKEKTMMHVLKGQSCFSWFMMEFGGLEPEDMEVLIEKIY